MQPVDTRYIQNGISLVPWYSSTEMYRRRLGSSYAVQLALDDRSAEQTDLNRKGSKGKRAHRYS